MPLSGTEDSVQCEGNPFNTENILFGRLTDAYSIISQRDSKLPICELDTKVGGSHPIDSSL